jgi:hypothetical protein
VPDRWFLPQQLNFDFGLFTFLSVATFSIAIAPVPFLPRHELGLRHATESASQERLFNPQGHSQRYARLHPLSFSLCITHCAALHFMHPHNRHTKSLIRSSSPHFTTGRPQSCAAFCPSFHLTSALLLARSSTCIFVVPTSPLLMPNLPSSSSH